MKRGYLAIAIAASLLTASCNYYTPVPIETVRPVSNQLDMQAAYHWDRLAERVAANIWENLPGIPGAINPIPEPQPLEAMPLSLPAEPYGRLDPMADLPPGTLPPPGPAPEINVAQAQIPIDPPQVDDNFGSDIRVVELDLNAPGLGLEPSSGQVFGTMSASASTMPAAPPMRPVLYINPPRGGLETPFVESFHKMLRSYLVQKGISITTRPNTVTANCTKTNFCHPMILDYTIDVVRHKDRWHVPQPESEVVISTQITDGDLVVFSRSDIYYINPGDSDHYRRGTKTLKVVDK